MEIALQGLRPLPKRSERLEQYQTPAGIAADMLWEAYGAGDIAGKDIADLGSGNGVLAIGAMLLGAHHAVGIDIDPAAVETAEANSADAGVEIEFLAGDVATAKGSFDTVVMNPPFGAQKRHADRPFVEKALELAPRTYSLHNEGSEAFASKLAGALGGRSVTVKRYKFEIPYAFEFHRKATMAVTVVLLRFER